ncbi:hypothetical protein ACWGH7_16655 [Streptomyces cyaneofuscatus]
MTEKQKPSAYTAFACSNECHPQRYSILATRTWYGLKRWCIHDTHMGVRLTKLCKNKYAAETWRGQLEIMEIRERQAIRQAPALRDLWAPR